MTTPSRAAFVADLAKQVFTAPVRLSSAMPLVGAEVELIPVDILTKQRCWIHPFLRDYGARAGWREESTSKGSPCFYLADGGTITFEPGGQVEFSTPPMPSATALLERLQQVVTPLCAAAASEGIELLTVGIDPFNSIERSPLVICGNRYERMADYFMRRHPAGAKMMRQTAAFQISLDIGDEPWPRWRVLNAAAPYVVAMFANSPIYAGAPTGCASARAEVWRALDPARTGLPYDERQPVEAYADFALAAPAMLLPLVQGEHRPFGEWLEAGTATADDWDEHLSTLFPEVRPRGHFELRSADAIPLQWYAAPVALAVGLAYEPHALQAAIELLGAPDASLLARAGRLGLRDPAIARTASQLADIAMQGCASLGLSYISPSDLERANLFFDRYTRRGRSPADDSITAAAVA